VLGLPVLPLHRHGKLTAAASGDTLVSVSVGPAGEAVASWSTPADQETLTSVTEQPGWASFPDARTARPVGLRITVQSPGLAGVVRIAGVVAEYASIGAVTCGCRWLCAGRAGSPPAIECYLLPTRRPANCM
jgi:hypothetical protein